MTGKSKATDGALTALARAYDKEEAAQRGEPDPWADGGDDAEWVSERLACAQMAEAAYLAAIPPREEPVEDDLHTIAIAAVDAHARQLDLRERCAKIADRYVNYTGGELPRLVRAVPLYAAPPQVEPAEGETKLVDRLLDAIAKWRGTNADTLFAEAADALVSKDAYMDLQSAELLSLRRKVEEQRRALEPFAKEAAARSNLVLGQDIDHWGIGENSLTLGDLRAAARALQQGDGAVDGGGR